MNSDSNLTPENVGPPSLLPPHLLNEVNRDLTDKTHVYEDQLDVLHQNAEQHMDKLRLMLEHLSNVQAEIHNTQELYEGKRRELESEDHMTQVAEREVGRIKQELGRMEKTESMLQEGIDSLQNAIFLSNTKMDEMKSKMNVNQDELEQWDMARRQKEQDLVTLHTYTKTDDVRLRDLNLVMERLSQEVQQCREELDREVTHTQAVQIELYKTAEDYQSLHRERQALMVQWEDAVKAMHERDDAIQRAGERYAQGKVWLQKRSEQLKDREKYHNMEIQNNKEIEIKISKEERILTKYRMDHTKVHAQLEELADEVRVVQNTMSKALRTVQAHEIRKSQLQQKKTEREALLARLSNQKIKLEEKMHMEITSAKGLAERQKMVEEMRQQTEQAALRLDKDVSKLKERQYQASQELFEVRRAQANLIAEISGTKAKMNNTRAKITQLDQESFKQQELLYNIEFQVQQMERKVNRAKGERTEEERRELQDKIDRLQEMLDAIHQQHKVVDLQVKRVHEDVRRAQQRHTQLDKVEKKSITDRVLELELQNESSHLELQGITHEKETALVHKDILQLEVRRLNEVLLARTEELGGMKNRAMQLEVGVRERLAEIQTAQELLRLECRLVEDERKRVSAELNERYVQVQHLKNRYILMLNRIQPRTDHDDSLGVSGHAKSEMGGLDNPGEISLAQYIINTAKEREFLQQKGDRLDEDIKRAERELKKLERTHNLLRGSNLSYKQHFAKVDENDECVASNELLAYKRKELQSIVHRRMNELAEYIRTEQTKRNEQQNLQEALERQRREVCSMEETLVALEQEADEFRESAARYEVTMAKLRSGVDDATKKYLAQLEEEEKVEHVIEAIRFFLRLHGNEALQGAFDALLYRRHDEMRAQHASPPNETAHDDGVEETCEVSSSEALRDPSQEDANAQIVRESARILPSEVHENVVEDTHDAVDHASAPPPESDLEAPEISGNEDDPAQSDVGDGKTQDERDEMHAPTPPPESDLEAPEISGNEDDPAQSDVGDGKTQDE